MNPDHRNTLLGIVAVMAAAVLWGTTGTTQSLLPAEREPLVVAALRMIFGALTLILLAGISATGRHAVRGLPWSTITAAGISIGLYNVLFFVAVVEAGVGVGTALAIGSAPIWVSLFDIVFRRRMARGRQLAGQAICIAGAVLLVVSGDATSGSALGVVLALLSGSAYAAYSLLTSRMSGAAPSNTIAAATFSVSAFLLAPLLLFFPVGWAANASPLGLLIFLGAIATGLSYALYTWGLKTVAPSAAVTFALIEPLTAWLLATFVVGEPVTVLKAAGAVILLFGLWIVTRTVTARGE